MRKPALTLAVLRALSTCVTRAESGGIPDLDTHADYQKDLKRADEWVREMFKYKYEQKRKAGAR